MIKERIMCMRPQGCGWSWDRIIFDNGEAVYGGPIFEDQNRAAYHLMSGQEFRDSYADCHKHLAMVPVPKEKEAMPQLQLQPQDNQYARYFMEIEPIIHDNYGTPIYLGKIRYPIHGQQLQGPPRPLIVPMTQTTPTTLFNGNMGTRIGVSFQVRFVDANAPQPETLPEAQGVSNAAGRQ